MVVSVLHFDVGTGLILLLYLMWLSVATTLNFSICATTVNRGKSPLAAPCAESKPLSCGQNKTPIAFAIGVSNLILTMTYFTWGNPTLPSAMHRFTAEFGMGSGGSNALWSSRNSVCRLVFRRFSKLGMR